MQAQRCPAAAFAPHFLRPEPADRTPPFRIIGKRQAGDRRRIAGEVYCCSASPAARTAQAPADLGEQLRPVLPLEQPPERGGMKAGGVSAPAAGRIDGSMKRGCLEQRPWDLPAIRIIARHLSNQPKPGSRRIGHTLQAQQRHLRLRDNAQQRARPVGKHRPDLGGQQCRRRLVAQYGHIVSAP